MGRLAGIAKGGDQMSDACGEHGSMGCRRPVARRAAFAQSTLAIALVLYEEAYGLRPVSFVSVGLLGSLTCLLFTVPVISRGARSEAHSNNLLLKYQ